MSSRKWKAFMRLNGESMTDDDQDIVKEFTGFAKQLEQIGIDYSIIVSIDRGPIRQYTPRTSRIQPIVSSMTTRRQARPEGD